MHLTPTEWQLLEVLVRNPGKLVSQRQLLQRGVGTDLRTARRSTCASTWPSCGASSRTTRPGPGTC